MSSVSTLVALIASVALVAEKLVYALASTACVFSVGCNLTVKVVYTVVTLLNVIIGFGLPLRAGMSINANGRLGGWDIDCGLYTSITYCCVEAWSFIPSQLRLETRISSGSSLNWAS